MPAYRFCRTDDIPVLVDALNRCWLPHFPAEPEMTIARFKREIRDLQVWCSSCMVAFAGSEPVGVLTGAKRSGWTLVHRIAVHPDHRRQGHGRHLLTSLMSKLSILGPPRIAAEVADAFKSARELFTACSFNEDISYSDLVLEPTRAREADPDLPAGRLLIPVTVDDLQANGLIGETDPKLCWERQVEALEARRNEITGLAIATEDSIEAYLLYASLTASGLCCDGTDVLAFGSSVADEGRRIRLLLRRLIAQRPGPVRINKMHPNELPGPLLEDLGFRSVGCHTRYTAEARAL